MSESFSILSYNIQAGIGTARSHQYVTQVYHQLIGMPSKDRRLRAIGKFLSPYDVVCLQEVDPGGRRAGFSNQGEILRKASGHNYHVFQENRSVRAISRHGNAILSRIAIKSWEDLKLPGRINGRGALVVELDMEPATVVACVHLSLGADDQAEQLAFLANHLALPRYGRARNIICGDLNCGAQATPINRFSSMTGTKPLTSSAHKTYPSWAPRLGLDHILSDDPAHAHDVEVKPVSFSDHLPVSATFRASILRP